MSLFDKKPKNEGVTVYSYEVEETEEEVTPQEQLRHSVVNEMACYECGGPLCPTCLCCHNLFIHCGARVLRGKSC